MESESLIFVHHDGALGDVLLSATALSAIRNIRGRVHLSCRRDVGRFFLQTGAADEVSDPSDSLFASLYTGHPHSAAARVLGAFGEAFVFSRSPDAPVLRGIRGVIPRVKHVCTLPPAGVRLHVSSHRLSQIRGSHGSEPARFMVPEKECNDARLFLSEAGCEPGRPIIAVHPGSGSEVKNWPAERFAGLLRMMTEAFDPFILLLTGPAEAEKAPYSSIIPDTAHGFHLESPGLLRAAALLSFCHCYIGNDSGMTHLASFFSRSGVSLFGPTDPLLWSPAGGTFRVAASGMSCSPCIPADGAFSCMRERRLSCSRECLSETTAGTVFGMIPPLHGHA